MHASAQKSDSLRVGSCRATKDAAVASGEDYININEGAAILGCCRHTLYELVRTNQITATRIGRHWKIKRSHLHRYMERGS